MYKLLKKTILYTLVTILLCVFAGAVCYADTPPQSDEYVPIAVYVNDKKINDTAYCYEGNIYVSIATVQKYGQTGFLTFDTPVDKIYFDVKDINLFLADQETTDFVKANAGTITLHIKYFKNVNHVSLGTIAELCKLDYRYENKAVYIYTKDTEYNFYRETKEKDTFDTPINLVWQTFGASKTMTSKDGRSFSNPVPKLAPAKTDSIDVMSPIWLRTNVNGKGVLTSYCDYGYVTLCHANGMKVWICVNNNFDVSGGPKSGNEILSTESYRNKSIAQMILYTAIYNADGINIDYESMDKSVIGDQFNTFIIELYKHCRKLGQTLSIDTMLCSTYWDRFYDYKLLGENSDYICPMTYNEHYNLKCGAGSTMSRTYYTTNTDNLIKYVPPEKILMGVPFFTQVWQINSSGTATNMWSVTENRALELIAENNATPVWNEKDGQYVATYKAKDAGCKIKIWMEDERGMAQKLKYVVNRGIAGTACWAYGQQDSTLLGVFAKVYKQGLDPDRQLGLWATKEEKEQAAEPKYSAGDVNGDGAIDANDITDLSRHIAKIEDIENADMLIAADVDGSGSVDANDLTLLSRYIAKIIDSFDDPGEPADETPADGQEDPGPSEGGNGEEAKPDEGQQDGQNADEQQAGEQKADEQQAGEQKAEDKQADEQKAEDKQAGEQKADEQQAGEQKADDGQAGTLNDAGNASDVQKAEDGGDSKE